MNIISEELQNKEHRRKTLLIGLTFSSGGFIYALSLCFFTNFSSLFTKNSIDSVSMLLPIQTQMNLILTAALLSGSLLGPFLFSRFTRNSLFIILSFLVSICSFLQIFANMRGLLALRFIVSFASGLYPILCNVMISEYIGSAHNGWLGSLFYLFTGLGFVYVALCKRYCSDQFIWLSLLIPAFVELTRLFFVISHCNFDSPVNTFKRLRSKALQGKDLFAVPEVLARRVTAGKSRASVPSAVSRQPVHSGLGCVFLFDAGSRKKHRICIPRPN